MHRSLTAALAVAFGLFLALNHNATAGPSAAEDAQRRLDRDDGRGAVEVLEAALHQAAGADRPALLDLLRRAYAAAVRGAEADGHADEAESFRENLDILNRTPRAGVADTTTKPIPVVAKPLPAPVSTPAKVAPDTPPAAVETPLSRVAAAEPKPTAPAAPIPLVQAKTPAPATATVKAAAEPSSPRSADEAFLAERYAEAAKFYAALDRTGQLPPDRRDHWAYCRAVAVVSKINAHPTSAREWGAIDAEIQTIRALSPSHWFSEYLRNLAAERNRTPHGRTARAGKMVVRGSSPEDPTPPVPTPAPAPTDNAVQPAEASTQVAWSKQPVGSPNFIVRHVDAQRALAEQVARAAESARAAQAKRWGPGVVPDSWDPRCEIVLFPNVKDFTRETLQPPDSPGFSTMGMNEGRIVLRRVHLRADHPNLVKAILPHEVTHVILADIFPQQQVPRWADEGIAVLSEPYSEQAVRAADLDEPLKAGRVFRVHDLMVMDYPAPEHWALYYAQSVSLTRFLVESDSPERFIRLVRSAQRAASVHLLGKIDAALPPDHPQIRARVQEALKSGFADALKEVYAISSFDDLHARWLVYARDHAEVASAVTASSADAGTEKGSTRR